MQTNKQAMKNLLYVALGLALVSCQPEAGAEANPKGEAGETNTINAKQTQDLKNEIKSLNDQLMTKDSLILNYYVAYINEIEENLKAIQGKQTLILNQQANPEMLSVTNPNLISELEDLASLLSENKSKIAKLKKELKNSDVQLGEYETTIISLSEQVEIKNMEVFQLQQDLENVDAAFGELFTAFQEKSTNLEAVKSELNTAYFALGSKKELLDAMVISTEGGVLGLGKNKELAEDFNRDYFTEINITELKEIPLGYSKIEFTTNHPEDSYQLVEGDLIEKIVITDAKKFWSVSKYLVIVVK
ncbi:MAG: hypothetical protein ACI9EV_002869 [Urechidicola sp.]